MSEYGCGRPYPAASMLRARELHEAGWEPPSIRRFLEEEGLPAPDVRTVHRWVDAKRNAKQLAAARRTSQRTGAARASFRLGGARGTGTDRDGGPSKAYQDAFVAALKAEGIENRETLTRVCRVVLGANHHPLPGVARPKGRPRNEDEGAALREMLALRRMGPEMTYPVLAVLLREYHGIDMGEERLRYRLTRMGAPRNPNKARATREQNAKRAASA